MTYSSNLSIKAENIAKAYTKNNHETVDVLKNLNFEINSGQSAAIVGHSGCGKSTFLQILGTLLKPNSGQVLIGNEAIFTKKDRELSSFRNKNIGFVFQFHHLLPDFTATENVAIPLLMQKMDVQKALKKAEAALKEVHLLDRKDHKPSAMSGGEQQRTAIARALVTQPKIVLADEPTGNLDEETGASVGQLLFEHVKQHHCALVVVTHNRNLAKSADRVLRLSNGCLIPENMD
ncbi:MAG TPA: ABC transporter ATP-binding protein [Oligoflexia bacterium]|nr:ABC transporter ATP-binding protein [Oligoflexia bacterium]HMR24114.1 ABC transporter ATP-binding protein [Oligoflexia bacterium]